MKTNRLRLATLLVVGILAGGLVSVATTVVAPRPAEAGCAGESCGRVGIEIKFSPNGPFRYGKPFLVGAVAEDTSHSCNVAGILCESATGTVEFYEDGVGPPIAVAALQASCDGNCMWSHTDPQEVCCIRAGTPAIFARYVPSGSTPFDPTDAQREIPVSPAPTATTLVEQGAPAVFGQPVTLVAQVRATVPIDSRAHPITQYVNFTSLDGPGGPRLLGGGFVEGGVARFTTNQLPLGTTRVRAEYISDGDYAVSSDGAYYDVERGDATNVLTQSSATTVFGEPFTLTSTLAPVAPSTGTPSGDVSFVAGTTTLGSATLNQANPDVALLEMTAPVGTHSIVAKYPGDEGFAPRDSEPVTHTVNKAATATILAAPTPNPSVPGQEVTVSASVAVVAPGAGTPTGAVQFLDGSGPLGAPIPLNGSTATLKVTALVGGSHSITARYSGDGNFLGSTSPAQTHDVRCDRTVSGSHGNYTVPSSGTTCVTGANVSGTLTIPAGARVSIIGSTIGGYLMADGAGSLVVCNSTFRGGVQVTRSSGPVVLGDLDQGCVGSNVAGTAQFTYNRAGVRVISNLFTAGLTVNDTTGGLTIIGANSVTGSLTCLRNNPAAANGGRSNNATYRSGECGAASF